jgi:hypothetical protein
MIKLPCEKPARWQYIVMHPDGRNWISECCYCGDHIGEYMPDNVTQLLLTGDGVPCDFALDDNLDDVTIQLKPLRVVGHNDDDDS